MKKIYENTFNVSSDSHVSYERLKEWIDSAIDHLKRVPGSNHYKITSGGKFIEVTRGVDIEGEGKRTFEVLIVENGYRKEIYQEDEPEAKVIPLSPYPGAPGFNSKTDFINEAGLMRYVYLRVMKGYELLTGEGGKVFRVNLGYPYGLATPPPAGSILRNVKYPETLEIIKEYDTEIRWLVRSLTCTDQHAYVPLEFFNEPWMIQYPNQRA